MQKSKRQQALFGSEEKKRKEKFGGLLPEKPKYFQPVLEHKNFIN